MRMTSSSRALKLRHNALWMVFGNGYYALCQWLVLVVIARIGGPEAVGQFTLALALTSPLILFFNLGMRTILAADTSQERTYSEYMMVRLSTAAIGFLVCCGVGFWYGAQVWGVVVMVALFKSLESIIDFYYGYAQQERRLNRIAISLLLRGTFSTLLLGAIYALTGSLIAAMAAYTVSWVVVLWTYDRHSVEEPFRPEWARYSGVSRDILTHGIPLGVTALMINLGPNIPRYVLEGHFGHAELGLFSSMAYFILVGGVVVNALGQALLPVLAGFHSKGDSASFWRLLLKALAGVAALGGVGVVAAWLLGSFVMRLIYGEAFAARADILPLIAVAAGLGYLGNIMGFGISAARIFVGQAPAFALTVLVSLLASFLLIPSWGLTGAAYTLILTALANCAAPLALLGLRAFRHSRKGKSHG